MKCYTCHKDQDECRCDREPEKGPSVTMAGPRDIARLKAISDGYERRAMAAEEKLRNYGYALESIATYDQDDRPAPGEPDHPQHPFDWRRRSMKQEDIARTALEACQCRH